MADEVTDASNIEQVAICLRSVDDNFDVHEDFIGMYAVESIKADILVEVLNDTLLRLKLPITNCRGQCYDGAANMAGVRNGVAAQLLNEEPRATFTHCYGHALNLATSDTVKKNKILRNTLDTTLEISKLIKFSPRRDATFHKLKSELAPETPGFHTLCPTRWTVRAESLQSVINNFLVLQELWDVALDVSTDSEARARIWGVKANMKTFDFVFGLVLGQRLLAHADNLSKTMQNPKMNASEAQHVADLTCQTLLKICDNAHFDLFWQFVIQTQEKFGISAPELPRKRKAPTRLQIGSSEGDHPHTVQDVYRPIYFECIDFIVSSIHDRFNQPGYIKLVKLENVLLKASKNLSYQEDLCAVLECYQSDFDVSRLNTQLQLFTTAMAEFDQSDICIPFIKSHLQSMYSAARANFSEICTFLKLIMVIPATNAVSERSASALRRVKTYLRSTMTQSRLNHLLILHCHKDRTDSLDHKDRTDSLDLTECLQEFVDCRERRSDVFGKFA